MTIFAMRKMRLAHKHILPEVNDLKSLFNQQPTPNTHLGEFNEKGSKINSICLFILCFMYSHIFNASSQIDEFDLFFFSLIFAIHAYSICDFFWEFFGEQIKFENGC